MNNRTTLGIVAVALVVSSCGGGGGGGGVNNPVIQPATSTPPVPAYTPVAGSDAFRTTEYNRMGALDAVHAADAYALGYTGAGVTIGIVDFNFDFSSAEVNFHPGSVGPDPHSVDLYVAQTGSGVPADQHGQAVASTAAARKNDFGIHGIAFNAQVLAVDYFSNVNETQFAQGGVLYHISDPFTYITSRGVRIVNTSFGYEAGDVIANPPEVSEAYDIATPATAVVNGALLVTAAGNAAGSNPSLYNLNIISDLSAAGALDSGAGALIIAGAVDANNKIASFSDRAGVYGNYYMVAPATNLILPWNGGFAILSGTSFSAPLISGAAAIIFERWPNLTARQVAEILFSSATDLGAPGVDAIYGHGLLNLSAALQPLGVGTLAVAGGAAPVVSGTGLMLGAVFGDAPALHTALSQVMMLDGFGRDFEIDLSRVPVSRPNLPDMFAVMENRLGWRSANYRVGSDTAFAFDVRRKPEDDMVPFEALAGPTDRFTHQTVFRLSGIAQRMSWAAGMGLSLHDGMAGENGTAFAAPSLTNAFSPMVGAAPGAFASLRLPLADDTGLSFGASHAQNQGLTDNVRTSFRNSADTASVTLDRRGGGTQFALDVGTTLETGGAMGSLASGGLKMADHASTVWTTATAETALDTHWSLKGAFTVAAMGATHPQASLITAIGPVYTTSFALGIAGESLFAAGDTLSFSVSQPLRAEHAALTLTSGIGRDWNTGGVIMGSTEVSLLPSGRELDFETGYGFSLGPWNAGANVAYALDADHVRDKNAVLALITLSRAF
jgi:hypothetical protein